MRCVASTMRTVPERDRITRLWVEHAADLDAHAAEQRPVGDAGGGEEAVVAADEVVGGEHGVEVVAGVAASAARSSSFCGPQPALDLAAHALQRRGGDDALGRAADAEEHVDAGSRPRRGDGAVDVAVGDQPDAGARRAHLLDQLGVAGAVEDDRGEVADRLAAWPWRSSAGSGWGDAVMSIAPTALGPDGDLLHVERRAGVEHRSPLADGDHRQGVASGPRRSGGCRRSGRRRRRRAAAVPSPTRSPLYSIGASSFSPSPMTTTPSIVHGRQHGAHRRRPRRRRRRTCRRARSSARPPGPPPR